MKKIVQRAKEPSTWAALAALAALFGGSVAPAEVQAVGGGVMALLGIVMPEQGGQ